MSLFAARNFQFPSENMFEWWYSIFDNIWKMIFKWATLILWISNNLQGKYLNEIIWTFYIWQYEYVMFNIWKYSKNPLYCLEFPISFNEMLIFGDKLNLNLDRKCLRFSGCFFQTNAYISPDQSQYICTEFSRVPSRAKGCGETFWPVVCLLRYYWK